MTKVCTKCKRELPVEAFQKRAKNKDGLDSQCRDCRKTYKQAWRAKQKQHIETALTAEPVDELQEARRRIAELEQELLQCRADISCLRECKETQKSVLSKKEALIDEQVQALRKLALEVKLLKEALECEKDRRATIEKRAATLEALVDRISKANVLRRILKRW